MRDFINDFKLAWSVARGSTIFRNLNIEDMKENPKLYEAVMRYRSLWPKSPLGCCEDAHEAGWLQGFIYCKKLKENINGIPQVSNGRAEESVHDSNQVRGRIPVTRSEG